MELTRRTLLLYPILGLMLSVAGCEDNTPQQSQTKIIAGPVSLRTQTAVDNLALLTDSTQQLADSPSTVLTVTPSLPAGLTFDSSTGRISGSPEYQLDAQAFTLTVTSPEHTQSFQVSIAVDDRLPDRIVSLAAGYNADVLHTDANMPVRMAQAPDGRLFYAELQTGAIRIIDPSQGLLPQPFANVTIVSGAEKGTLGLALDPDFQNNGYVYIHATVPENNGNPEHAEIIRYTDVANTGVNPVTIVDQLPIADLHNGGDLVFDLDGNLLIGRGDITDPATAQQQGNLSGKVLRYTAEGGIPADNPFPGDPEWSRGLRNTFALAIHPQTGDLFGADAGPTSDDKLNYLKPGKNFLWGMEEEPQGSSVGYSVRIWHEVITPTALLFHTGSGGFERFSNQLFVSSYNAADIRVIHLAGEAYTDFIREEAFAQFDDEDFASKPLHMIESANGDIFVSTFDTIYRIYKN